MGAEWPLRDRPWCIGSEWAVIAHADDTIERITHPAPWATVRQQRRRVARRRPAASLAPRAPGESQAGGPGPEAANLRRESIHTLTTTLARRYGTIVVENLDVAAMG